MLTPGNAWVGATVTPAASAMRTLLDFSPSSYNYNSMSPAVAGFMLSDLDGSFAGAECYLGDHDEILLHFSNSTIGLLFALIPPTLRQQCRSCTGACLHSFVPAAYSAEEFFSWLVPRVHVGFFPWCHLCFT